MRKAITTAEWRADLCQIADLYRSTRRTDHPGRPQTRQDKVDAFHHECVARAIEAYSAALDDKDIPAPSDAGEAIAGLFHAFGYAAVIASARDVHLSRGDQVRAIDQLAQAFVGGIRAGFLAVDDSASTHTSQSENPQSKESVNHGSWK